MAHTWPVPKIEYAAFSEWEEQRSVTVVTTHAAWEAVKNRLHFQVASLIEVTDADEAVWESLLSQVKGEVIYAIGGGLAVDTAKFLAVQKNMPLICMPTVLSVDAFLTWAAGVRRDGCVYYIEAKPPELLVIDFDVLAAAPVSIRAAGVCDTLSIATGSWDWRFAQERGQNPPNMQYVPYADQIAEGVLQGTLDCAEAAGHGDRDGLKQLLDCLTIEVQLCNLLGHPRPEEGSEHYFAYSVENTMGKGLPHGDLVGPGILLIAALQGQDIEPLRRALIQSNIPLGNIPNEVVNLTIRTLPDYARRHNLPYGIAHELNEGHFSQIPSLS